MAVFGPVSTSPRGHVSTRANQPHPTGPVATDNPTSPGARRVVSTAPVSVRLQFAAATLTQQRGVYMSFGDFQSTIPTFPDFAAGGPRAIHCSKVGGNIQGFAAVVTAHITARCILIGETNLKLSYSKKNSVCHTVPLKKPRRHRRHCASRLVFF